MYWYKAAWDSSEVCADFHAVFVVAAYDAADSVSTHVICCEDEDEVPLDTMQLAYRLLVLSLSC